MKKFSLAILSLFLFCLPIIFVGCNNEKNIFTITVNSVAGGNINIANLYVEAGSEVEVEVTPNNGYKLDYLTLDGVIMQSNTFTMPKSNVIISGHFKTVDYTINYHLAGGEVNNPNNPTTYNVETQTFELLAPTKKGYTFVGWFKNEQRTSQTAYIPKGSFGNIDLYPKWEKTAYHIIYNLNDGNNSQENPSTFWFDDGNISLAPAEKEGFEFLGWFQTEDFSDSGITYIDSSTCRDYTLYAKFTSTAIEDGYRIITNKTDFVEILKSSQNWNLKLRLKADLDLSGVEWSPIGSSTNPFTGEFDGDGHRIDNITISDARNYNGLFGFINGATIKNLTITYRYNIKLIYTLNNACFGGLVGGSGSAETKIENCNVSPVRLNTSNQIDVTSVRAPRVYAGGIIGSSGSATNIVNCHVLNTAVKVAASSYAFVGGISGYAGNLRQCSYEDTVGQMLVASIISSGEACVGGLVGYGYNSVISNSYFYGEKTRIYILSEMTNNYSTTMHVGGLVGSLIGQGSKLEYSFAYLNTIQVEAQAFIDELCVGGLVGKMQNCSAEGCYVDTTENSPITINVGGNINIGTEVFIGYAIGKKVSARIRLCYASNQMVVRVFSDEPIAPTEASDKNIIATTSREYILSFVNSNYNPDIWLLTENSRPRFI